MVRSVQTHDAWRRCCNLLFCVLLHHQVYIFVSFFVSFEFCFVFFFFCHRFYICFVYIDSPPRRSPGRNEFRLDGVARDWSPESRGVEPQRLVEVAFGQPVLQVLSAAVTCCLLEPRQEPDEPDCWLATCWRWMLASHSVGFSARIVVLPRTQLLRAC